MAGKVGPTLGKSDMTCILPPALTSRGKIDGGRGQWCERKWCGVVWGVEHAKDGSVRVGVHQTLACAGVPAPIIIGGGGVRVRIQELEMPSNSL